MMKDNSCRLIFWMILGLAIEIAVISWLFHNAIEKEKKFIREYKEADKTYLLYERLK
jgi:hydrogenase-4 membrane subunit HyfE